MQCHHTKLFQAALTALLMLVTMAGAAVAGQFDDAAAAYSRGDYATVLRLVRPLADQGDADGQYLLGTMYRYGYGVTQDYVRAYMWFSLSAAGGEQRAVTGRDMAAKRMTAAQIAEAQKLAREMRKAAGTQTGKVFFNSPDAGKPNVIDQLQQEGYSADEIAGWVNSKRPAMKAAGYTDQQIDQTIRDLKTPQGPISPPEPQSPYQSEGDAMMDVLMDTAMRPGAQSVALEEIRRIYEARRLQQEAKKEMAVAEYIHAIQGIRDDPRTGWQQKEQMVKQLIARMWADQRLPIGYTKLELEKDLLNFAGMTDTRSLGPGYGAALNGILTGEIKSIKQILEMENSHALTNKGADELIERFTLRDKPAQ